VQPTAPRIYNRLGLFAGRRGAKSVSGALGAREEMLVPNSLGWVVGPTYKVLNDATMPTLLNLIPRHWCADWNAEFGDLTLTNGAKVSFRSMDNPDAGHAGVGVHWTWWDEAAFIAERGWHYFRPALADYGGVAFFSSSVDGYDWTYEHVEKPALIDHKPGYWAAKWRTIDNPYIMADAQRVAVVESDKLTMPPQLYRQEYEAERENFEGSVYGEWINDAWLPDNDAVEKWIPEWPRVDPSRRVLIGLDSGADHPFGAVKMVVCEGAIVIIADYLERQRAYYTHIAAIQRQFVPSVNTLWTANLNEAQLRAEFAAQGVLVAEAANDQEAGRQRVLSWLYTRQLKIAYTCPRTFEQMKQLKFADNKQSDGQKRDREKVVKLNDELPDCVRYALMTWPRLPSAPDVSGLRDLRTLDPKTQWELEKVREFGKAGDERDLEPVHDSYPSGDFWGVAEDVFGGGW
jgi:hypothetical protein